MTSIPSTIPLFPLPDVVLFPRMPLPLHIFEPRYRKMTSDVMAGHKIIGMTLLKPGWEKDYYGRPPVYPIGCAGVVEECRPLEDGRFNIRLKGVSRFRILSEQGGEPYRLASSPGGSGCWPRSAVPPTGPRSSSRSPSCPRSCSSTRSARPCR
ncbi:MAG: hypothetical protein DMF82_02640 [Acidobacteria bacterium]|nr:MAG: hypothetical protein DMF82_02640 [Acidobacteriota bacterium]